MKKSLSKSFGSKLVATALAAVAMFAAVPARADQQIDWGKLLIEVDHIVRTGTKETPQKAQANKRFRGEKLELEDPNQGNLGNAWFGVAPKVSLVARDWASSTHLAGDKLGLLDSYRLSASTRMVVGRVRFSGARIAPFMQLGFGQWRVDTRFNPLTPQEVEIAGQLGTGLELRMSRRWQIAAEFTATSLIREGQFDQQPQNVLWSGLVASRIEW